MGVRRVYGGLAGTACGYIAIRKFAGVIGAGIRREKNTLYYLKKMRERKGDYEINKPSRKERSGDWKAEVRQSVYWNPRWGKLRRLKLSASPLCERCIVEDKIVPATQVHHIKSFMEVEDAETRYALAFDYENLQSLCSACHSKLHSHGNKV
jgi:5-methylcytosine-specific restriction protein A